MAITHVAVAGVTGRFSRLLVSQLLLKPDVQVHGIARDPDKVEPAIVNHPRFKLFQANADESNKLRAAVAGTSVCVCGYLGDNTLMVQGQKTLIDACIAEGVKRYVPSDYSFDFRSLKLGDHPAKDFHLHVAAYLDEKEKAGQIKAVHTLVGAFMEVVWSPFLSVYDADTNTLNYWGTGDHKWDLTSYRDAAHFVAEIACDPTATGYLAVLGDRVSIKDMAKTYHAVYGGKEPTLHQRGSMADLHSQMTSTFAAQPENIYGWVGMFYNYYMSDGSTTIRKPDNERYPDLKTETLEQFLGRWKKEELPRLMG